MKLTQQQLEAHLWGAANILRGKTAGQDYKNYILSLMFYKRLCDQWENEADEAIVELERQQGRSFTEAQKAIFRARGEHRFTIPEGSRWGDVLAESINLGERLTAAMRAVANVNDELRGVFTVDWNQPAPDGSGRPVIPNEVVHALIQHFDTYDLSNASVPPDVLGRAYEYLIKQFADDAGAKAGEFFTPPEVVDILVRCLDPRPGDTIYDPTCGSGGMLVSLVLANFPFSDELWWLKPEQQTDDKKKIMRVAKRTTNLASTNKTQVRAFRFPVPPLDEQQRIAAVIMAAKAKIRALERKEDALEQLKKSLMHDLLTGKVRVGEHSPATDSAQ